MNDNTSPLTTDLFDELELDERWGGWGYLGERTRYSDPVTVAAADQRVIDHANAAGWSREDLFAWANSRTGRFYADAMLHGVERFDVVFDRAVAQGLLELPTD